MKKGYIILVTILLIVFILFNVNSCVRSTPIKNEDETDVKLPDDGKVDDNTDNVVTIILDIYEDIKLFDPFLEENPGIKLVHIPGRFSGWLNNIEPTQEQIDKVDVAPPDIYLSAFRSLKEKEIKQIEYAESLDKFILEEPESIAHIFPEAMELVKHDGAVKGIPFGWARETMLYNKTIFDAAAINYPEDDWTISDMISIAEAIKEYSSRQEGDPIVAISVDEGDVFFYYYMIGLMGGQLYKMDGNELIRTISTDSNTVSALSLIKELVKNELLYLYKSSSSQAKITPAITFCGSLSISKIEEYLAVGLPRGTDTRVGYIISNSYSIHKNSPNKEICWKLLKYMAGDHFQTKLFDWNIYTASEIAPGLSMLASFPTSKSILDMELSDWAREDLEGLIEESNYALNMGEYELKILKLLDEEMQKVFKGEEDLMTALTRVDNTILNER